MADWYLTDGANLIAHGHCQDGLEKYHAQPGAKLVLGKPPANLKPAEAPEDAYDKKRAANYPSIGEQLDSLWHAMEQGQLPRVEPFYSKILAVKQAHPKPPSN